MISHAPPENGHSSKFNYVKEEPANRNRCIRCFAKDSGDCRLQQTELIITLGIVFLLFRLWLVEHKLVGELQFRRRYLSRFMNYYAGIALAFGLTIQTLNIIVLISFPILVVTVGWDINFYRFFQTRDYWKKNRRWILVERLTLHPPVFLLGLAMILIDAQFYFRTPSLHYIVLSAILLYIPFFIFDARWRTRYNWPQALIVIMLVGLSSLSLAVAQFLLWGVPVW